MIREPENMFPEMTIAIGCSLSNHTSSDNRQDRVAGADEETAQGKLSKDDEPGKVMGTISKLVHQHIERYRQKQMKRDELNHPGWGMQWTTSVKQISSTANLDCWL
jgi:hypothetical protein